MAKHHPPQQLELPVLMDVNGKHGSTNNARSSDQAFSLTQSASSKVKEFAASPHDQSIYKMISDNYFRRIKA